MISSAWTSAIDYRMLVEVRVSLSRPTKIPRPSRTKAGALRANEVSLDSAEGRALRPRTLIKSTKVYASRFMPIYLRDINSLRTNIAA